MVRFFLSGMCHHHRSLHCFTFGIPYRPSETDRLLKRCRAQNEQIRIKIRELESLAKAIEGVKAGTREMEEKLTAEK